MAPSLPNRTGSRSAQNCRRTPLLLLAASIIQFPFALAWSLILSHGLAALVPAWRGLGFTWIVISLCAFMFAMTPYLYLRFTWSPLRVLLMCGPMSARTPALEARQILENLARRVGLPVPRLYIADTLAPNSYCTGVSPSKAVIVVTRGLLRLLTEREKEAVLAHQLAQIANYDTRWNMAVAAIAQYLRLPFRPHSPGQPASRRRRHAVRSNPFGFLLLPFVPVVFLAAPMLAVLLHAIVFPRRKTDADAQAAEWTGDPIALLTALVKIKFADPTVRESDPVMAHLYFVDPCSPGISGISRGQLFSSHPAYDERIESLRSLAGGVASAYIDAAQAAGESFASRRDGWDEAEREELENDARALAFLAEGDRTCSAKRVESSSAVYELDDAKSDVVAHVKRGDLVIALHQSGTLQQIITSEGKFGFLPRHVQLTATDRLPQDVLHDTDERPPEYLKLSHSQRRLTKWQLTLATLFGFVVFVAVVSILSFIRH